jgi:hypothetical protein
VRPTRLLLSLLAVVAATALLFARGGAEAVASPPPPAVAPGKYLGASTCDGANCHAKPEPREKAPYLTEYTSWSALKEDDTPYDRHSYAWKRLRGSDKGGDDRSPEIMAKLNALEGTKEVAEASQRCLSCHGTSVHDYGVGGQNPGLAVGLNKELQGARYRPEEGVSCDGCHGPGEKWLKLHDKEGWTLNEWAKEGGAKGGSQKLYDKYGIYYSKDLELWGNQCVRCHLKIDTNLLDAGHPDLLSFELFAHNQQVPHWRDYGAEADDPKLPGAGPTHAASEWLVGQVVSVREALAQVKDRAGGQHHNKPTLAHLRTAAARVGAHFGVVRHALKKVAADKAGPISEKIAALLAAVGALAEPPAPADLEKVVAAAGAALDAVKPLARVASDARLDAPGCQAVMGDIAADADGTKDTFHSDQQRMALYALNYARLNATNPDELAAENPTDPIMIAVYELYGTPDPASDGYKAGLAKVKKALGR